MRSQTYKSGIYKIINKVTGKLYIGSAEDIVNRWGSHRKDLRKEIHANVYLQRAWNKYGEETFAFEVIEFTPSNNKKFRLEREQYWMDKFQSYKRKYGYNLLPKAGSPLGSKKKVPNWNLGIKTGPQLAETCRKKSLAHLGKKRKPFTKKHRKNISLGRRKLFRENPEALIILRESHKGQPSWNKGLTKKDHPSIARTARKLSKLKKGVPVGPFSEEHKRNLSIANSRPGKNDCKIGIKQSKETQERKRKTYYKNHPQYVKEKI
jgi:group I intron endonuclease